MMGLLKGSPFFICGESKMKKFTTLGEYWILAATESYRKAKKTKQCHGKKAEGDILYCTVHDGMPHVTPRGKAFKRLMDIEWNARLERG